MSVERQEDGGRETQNGDEIEGVKVSPGSSWCVFKD